MGLCTVAGFVLAVIAHQPLTPKIVIIIFSGTVAIGILAAYIRGKQKLLPNIFIDEISSENSYDVSFCTQQGLREADEMTKPYFGKGFIPSDRIEQWRLRNEKGFIQINNSEGILCACFVILGLRHSFLEQFIAGKLTEHDIDSSEVLPFQEAKGEARIYISGVVVKDPGSFIGAKRAKIMVWTMLEYIKRAFGLRKLRKFYALGLTRESEKLLHAMEFKVCSDRENRKDGCNLYRIDLDRDNWMKLLAKIGDFSRLVNFNISF